MIQGRQPVYVQIGSGPQLLVGTIDFAGFYRTDSRINAADAVAVDAKFEVTIDGSRISSTEIVVRSE